MAGVYELKYRDGRQEELWSEDNCYYVLAPDHLRRVNTVPAWCRNCDAVEAAECLRTPEDIELEIRDCDNPSSTLYRKYFASSPSERVLSWQLKLKEELAHTLVRKSPARCLKCGQTNVLFFEYGKWVRHPKTQEEIMFRGIGIGTTSVWRRFFDSEGVRFTPDEADTEHYLCIIRERKL